MTIRSVFQRAVLALAGLTLVLSSSTAFAQKKGKRGAKAAATEPARRKVSIALGAFSGNKPKEVRGWVYDAIQDDFLVTDAEDFKPKNTNAGYAKMASDLGVEAVIVGKLERNRLVLTVRDGDGKVVKEIVVKAPRGPKLKRAIESGVSGALGQALGVGTEPEEIEEEEEPDEEPGAPPEDAEPTDSSEAESEAEPADEESEGTAPGLVATVGVKFLNRKLTFNDTLTQLSDMPLYDPAYVIRDYELQLDPILYVNLQLYPGALLGGEGFIANLGIVGAFEQGIPVTSKYAGTIQQVPRELKNNTQEWYAGLRMRMPGSSSEFGAVVTYGEHKFILEGDEAFPIIPDTTYGNLRLGADAALSFGKVFATLDVGVRFVLSSGELEKFWFRNASGLGLDVGLRLGYELSESFSVVLGGDMIRYGFDFNAIDPERDTRVAGGAIDQYLSGTIGLRWVVGGGSSKGFGLAKAEASVSAGGSESDDSEASDTSDADSEEEEASEDEE